MDLNYIKKLYHERHLSKQELKKREEIAQAIEKENPGIDMGKKMAIAAAAAKKAKDIEHKITEVSEYDAVVTFMRAHGLDPYKLKGEVGHQTREKIKNSPAFKAWKRINQYEDYEMFELEELEQIDEFFSNVISAAKAFAKEKGIPLLKKIKGSSESSLQSIIKSPSFPSWIKTQRDNQEAIQKGLAQAQNSLYASYISDELAQVISEKKAKEFDSKGKKSNITFYDGYPEKNKKKDKKTLI